MDTFNKLALGLKTFVENADRTQAVLGLSGGVDSALTAAIAAKALGAENVSVIMMPNEKLTDPKNIEDAEKWARHLSVRYYIVPINPFLKDFDSLHWEASVLADMNCNARVRANILYHFANTHDAIVLGTGNKTEIMLGYFTKYGDGACDVEVIGNLYKTEVWEMAKEIGVLESIVNKTPSAELFPGQTDEEELGFKYHEADEILKQIEQGQTPTGETADKVRALMLRTEHKREMPPAIGL